MSFFAELRGLTEKRLLQLIALCGLLVLIAKICVDRKYAVLDFDTWWHLRTGDWIWEHAAVPHNGLFSRVAADRPWMAYSWGFEVALSRAYHWLGLFGIGLFGTLLTLTIAYATFWSLFRLSRRFWVALALAGISLSTYLFLIMPRPVFVSIALYILLLTWILEASRSGDLRWLRWLPLIFCFWANIHIQFIYGLFIFALFVGTQLLLTYAPRYRALPGWIQPATLPVRPLLIILGATSLATMVGPYGYHLYGVILSYSKSKVTYDFIIELLPSTFRYLAAFVMLFMAATGFVAVGSEKRVDLYKLILLLVASMVGLRTVRDCWFLVFTAAAMIADRFFDRTADEPSLRSTAIELSAVVCSLALFLCLLSRNYNFNEAALGRSMSEAFPVDAVNYLRRNPVSGPLYNNLDWGGFLIWYMPWDPVAIDGRNDLYGDALDREFFEVQNGFGYRQSKYFNEAQCVLMSRKYLLSNILRFDPNYRLYYEDSIAVVFVKISK